MQKTNKETVGCALCPRRVFHLGENHGHIYHSEEEMLVQHTSLELLHIHTQAFVRTCMRKQSLKAASISIFSTAYVPQTPANQPANQPPTTSFACSLADDMQDSITPRPCVFPCLSHTLWYSEH